MDVLAFQILREPYAEADGRRKAGAVRRGTHRVPSHTPG
jgi:hypothetical protein